MSFTNLSGGLQRAVVPLEVPLNRGGNINPFLPGDFQALTTPQLAADPTDADRLYLVYHDTATADLGDVDVNIYIRKMTRLSASIWTVWRPVKVNDDVALPEDDADQFLPSVTVDNEGRIHVIFYDDRNYEQPDSEADPKFDAYYALSIDQGATFTNFELDGIEPAPALDFGLTGPTFTDPGEYIGISYYAGEVWTSFTGTSTLDGCQTDKSVIFSSLIGLTP